jgi:hypothetical protein
MENKKFLFTLLAVILFPLFANAQSNYKLFVKHQFSSSSYYEISNSIGQVLIKGYIKPADLYIDIRQLNAGAYILSIKEDNSKVSQFKFIKK